MKFFVEEHTVINPKKIEKLLIEKRNMIEIYSKEGIYHIDENKTYKLMIKNEGTERITMLNGNTLVIDKSNVEKKETHQIPVDHISIPITRYIYKLKDSKTPIKLLIDYVDSNDLGESLDRPINIYFYNDDRDSINQYDIEIISEFLSKLN